MKKRGKKAQITIFIILAIVIIAGIGLFFIFRERVSFGGGINPEVVPIYDYIESCIKEKLINGVVLVGLQGGYVNVPQQHLQPENLTPIAYGYYEGNNVLPSKEKIEREISNYIESKLPGCLDSGSFPGFEIKKGKISSSVKIKNTSVSASVNYPLSISKGDTTYSLKEYSIEIPSKLGDVHTIAQKMVEQLMTDPEHIDMIYLTNLDYRIIILPYNDKTFIYSIHDLNKTTNETLYLFRFANKLK